jgi:two-component system chemotaxis sensor kinase CheA/two-component system sensor histidine kinase and response regulator WspE
MSEELRKKLLPKFRETTADRIEKIQGALLDLEKGTGGPDNVQELARELHTLKGESRIMGFIGISQVVHAAEDLLKAVAGKPTPEAIDALLKACDAIPPMVEVAADGGPEAKALVERLQGMVAGVAGEPAAPAAEAKPPAPAPPAPAAAKEAPPRPAVAPPAPAPAAAEKAAPAKPATTPRST